MLSRFSSICFLLPLLILTACGGAPEPQPLESIDIPFTGESVMGDVNDDTYRFFRYQSIDDAKADITKVSPDGQMIDGKQMPWDGPVHIYYLRKRIVIYVGDNEETIKQIEEVFGPQVAGE